MHNYSLILGSNEQLDQMVGDQYVLIRKTVGGGCNELWLCDYVRPSNRDILIRTTHIYRIDESRRSQQYPIPENNSFYYVNGHNIIIGLYSHDKPNKLIMKLFDTKLNCTKSSKKEEYAIDLNNPIHYVIRNKLFYHNIIVDLDTFNHTYLPLCIPKSRTITSDNMLYCIQKRAEEYSYYTIDTNVLVLEGAYNYQDMSRDTYIFFASKYDANNRTCKFVRKELQTKKLTNINFANSKIHLTYQPKMFDTYEVVIENEMTQLETLEQLYEMLQDALNKTDGLISYEITPSNENFIFELRDNHKYHKMLERYELKKVPDQVTIDKKMDYILRKIEGL